MLENILHVKYFNKNVLHIKYFTENEMKLKYSFSMFGFRVLCIWALIIIQVAHLLYCCPSPHFASSQLSAIVTFTPNNFFLLRKHTKQLIKEKYNSYFFITLYIDRCQIFSSTVSVFSFVLRQIPQKTAVIENDGVYCLQYTHAEKCLQSTRPRL